ncbi:MAG: hypothetical protein ABI585_03955 [Betaproteobacteria bacterium]
MNASHNVARLGLALLCATAATPALAQAQDGRWSCQVGGVDMQLTIAGEQAMIAFETGERFTLKLDPTLLRPYYTDGKVALRLSGGGPESSRSPEWVRSGAASTVERCVRTP